jgi:hypothetical protein
VGAALSGDDARPDAVARAGGRASGRAAGRAHSRLWRAAQLRHPAFDRRRRRELLRCPADPLLEGLFGRIPVVKSIYSSVKQVSDTLLSDSGNAFRKALLVEFPHDNAWTIAS